MTTIALFEAKERLAEICEQVAKRREPIVITRRGRPLVRIEPAPPGRGITYSENDARKRSQKKEGGPWREEFSLTKRVRQIWRNPLGT